MKIPKVFKEILCLTGEFRKFFILLLSTKNHMTIVMCDNDGWTIHCGLTRYVIAFGLISGRDSVHQGNIMLRVNWPALNCGETGARVRERGLCELSIEGLKFLISEGYITLALDQRENDRANDFDVPLTDNGGAREESDDGESRTEKRSVQGRWGAHERD